MKATFIVCPSCRTKIVLNSDDLIKLGREQVINEVNKILEKLKK